MYYIFCIDLSYEDSTRYKRQGAMIAWPGVINKIGRRDFGVFQRLSASFSVVLPFKRKLNIFDFKDSAFGISM